MKSKTQKARALRSQGALAIQSLIAVLLWCGCASAQTATIVGYPANFDAVNNTGEETHGFEIEADGISSADITRIFGDNFIQPGGACLIRYCAGKAVDFAGGVYIRWMSPWDPKSGTFTKTTPLPNGAYAGGESCWTFGLGAAYPASGCEHFGISSTRQPTQVTYRWLVADPVNPGQLIRFAAPPGTGLPPVPVPVPIPQPVINIVPQANPAAAPVVDFAIQLPPPPPRVVPQFGDAQWVKVYKSESPDKVDLNHLLVGNAVVPNAAQVETEWKLLQRNPHSASSGVLHNRSPRNGKNAIVRRYVFYKYTGKYDPATHEAICGGDGSCSVPKAGEQGPILGDQMAAANIDTPSVTVTKVGSGTVISTNSQINCGNICTLDVNAGTVVDLQAVVPSNEVFGGWTGACSGNSLDCSLTVKAPLTATATFTPVFTLSIGRGGKGTVVGTPAGVFHTAIDCGSSCSAKFPQGTAVTLTATSAAGLKFVNWSGSCAGTTPTCTVSISKDTQVQANFK